MINKDIQYFFKCLWPFESFLLRIFCLVLYRIFKIERTAAAGAGYLAAVIFYLDLHGNWIPDKMMLVTGFLIVLLAVYVLSYPKYHASQVMAVFFGVFYVAVMLSCIYQTRVMEKGAYLVWLIFLCSWGCDTCAYCVGVKFGKHKMSPLLSPKKSMEGRHVSSDRALRDGF